jgi:hypothetical protein
MRERQDDQKAADDLTPNERRKDRDDNKKRPAYDTLSDDNPMICRGTD